MDYNNQMHYYHQSYPTSNPQFAPNSNLPFGYLPPVANPLPHSLPPPPPPRMAPTGGASSGGNWICGLCGNLNFAHRNVCNKRTCGVKKEDAAPQFVPSGPAPPPVLPPTSISPTQALAVLSTLLAMNDPKRAAPSIQSNKKRIRGPEDYNWVCPSCGNENWASRTHCNLRKCGKERPENTKMWHCVKCGNWNLPSRKVCNIRKCMHPRDSGDQQAGEGGSGDQTADGVGDQRGDQHGDYHGDQHGDHEGAQEERREKQPRNDE